MMNTAGRSLLIAGTITVFLLFLARNFANVEGGIDFPDFYCAGVMARQRVNLYDPAAQQHCQMREANRKGTYYIHPPFEALAFAPLASLSVKQAYLAWNLMGCLVLVLTWRTLVKTLRWKLDWGVLFAIGLLFPTPAAEFCSRSGLRARFIAACLLVRGVGPPAIRAGWSSARSWSV